MREIKFRGWSKTNNLMYYNVQNAYDTLENHSPLGDKFSSEDEEKYTIYEHSFGDVLKKKYLIVMQFTGLKDKQEKEIYEGDIVYSKRSNNRGRVFWHDSRAMFMVDDSITDKFIEPNDDWDDYEVIGNIYENSELMKPV